MSASGSLNRQVLSLALPALGTLIAAPIFVLIDSAMVGHLGTAPLAGLSVASTIVQTVVYLFVFLLFSTTTRAAQAYGRRNIPQALTIGIQSTYLAVGIGTLLAVGMFLGGPWLLSFFSASPEAVPHALAYLRTSSPGIVGMFVVMAATGTLRGMHDTRAALAVSGIGALTNVGLNALLIYYFEWGVGGSGAGTSITQLLMAITLLVLMGRRARTLHHRFTTPAHAPGQTGDEAAAVASGTEAAPSLRSQVSLRPSVAGVRASVRDGWWLLIRTIGLRVALLAITFVVTGMGVEVMAAHHIAATVWGFLAYALDSLAIAGQTLLASSLAAQDSEADDPSQAIHEHSPADLLRLLTRWAALCGLGIGVVVGVASPFIPRFFSTDDTVIHLSMLAILCFAPAMPLAGTVFLYDGIMMGADQARYLARWSILALGVHLPALCLVGQLGAKWGQEWALIALWVEICWVLTLVRALSLVHGIRQIPALRSPSAAR